MKPTVRYKMSDMVTWSLDELLNHEQQPIILECDDGEVEGVIEEFTLSWFLWEFHRRYPDTPCHLSHTFAGALVTPNTHLNVLGAIQKDCFLTYSKDIFEPMTPYNALAYECYNNLYNFISGHLTRFITSISILDFLQVMRHPEVVRLKADFAALPNVTPADIKQISDDITHVLDTETCFRGNALQRAFKHRLVRVNAILQDIAPRGFVTDVDSVLFPKPIMQGYVEGIRELADYAAETRTASQAAMMQKAPMEDAEHLNRLLQLSVSRVAKIERMDCGSNIYADWYIEDRDKLKDMHGMYYLDETLGAHIAIDPIRDTHLIYQTVKLRTVFGCQHPDRNSICAVCFGELSVNFYPTDNIGHISAIEFQSNQSQKLMSYKHYTASATSSSGVYMDEIARQYFELSASVKTINFRQDIDLTNTQILIDVEAFKGFEAVLSITNWKAISPVRICDIVELVIIPNKDNMGEVWNVRVADAENPVHFSLQALKFLSKTKYTINHLNQYVFDFDGWDNKEPLFIIPRVQFDVLKYLKQIESFVSGPKPTKVKVESIVSYQRQPIKALKRLHDLVTTGGPDKKNPDSMPLSHLQVVVLAMSAEDPENGDFRIPINRMSGNFAGLRAILFNSSSGVMLAYQEQEKDVFNAGSYIGRNKPDHALDNLLLGDM